MSPEIISVRANTTSNQLRPRPVQAGLEPSPTLLGWYKACGFLVVVAKSYSLGYKEEQRTNLQLTTKHLSCFCMKVDPHLFDAAHNNLLKGSWFRKKLSWICMQSEAGALPTPCLPFILHKWKETQFLSLDSAPVVWMGNHPQDYMMGRWMLKSSLERLPGSWADPQGASTHRFNLSVSQPWFMYQLGKLLTESYHLSVAEQWPTKFTLFISIFTIKWLFQTYLYKIFIPTEIIINKVPIMTLG